MLDVCEIIKVLLKYKNINTENNVFRLHYKFTVILLLLFSFLVTSKQYFGDPIDCETDSQFKYVLDTYCWIYSTFTVKRHLTGKTAPNDIYPGVGPSRAIMVTSNTDEIIVHKYYQWVCIVLFLQAVLFYIPKYLWKIWEAGRLNMLVKDFGLPVVQSSPNNAYKEYLINYLLNNRETHNIYMVRFTVCEILNLFNVVFQIFIMDWFLSGHFSGYGIAVAMFSASNYSENFNPMSHVFPKLAKCTYANIGPSGTVQNFDALCVLPLNVVNEKIYMVLWFWFVTLAIISLLAVVYRILLICNKTVRIYLLLAQSRFLDKKTAKIIVDKLSTGDWFILHQLGKNMNPIIFQEIVNDLGRQIAAKNQSKYLYRSEA